MCAFWCDDFDKDGKLNHKWTSTRLSGGGQNDGVWNLEVKDSKLYMVGVSGGTESGFWGHKLSLPVNATGDIVIEGRMRHHNFSGGAIQGIFGVGINHNLASSSVRCGVEMNFSGTTSNYTFGRNSHVKTPWPGMPSTVQVPLPGDTLADFRIVRNADYVSLYIYGIFVGKYSFSSAITTVDIVSCWRITDIDTAKYLDYIKIYPEECVL